MMNKNSYPIRESNQAIYDQSQESLNKSYKRRLIADNERHVRKQKLKTLGAVLGVTAGLLVAGNMDRSSEEETARTTPPVELIQKTIAKNQASHELNEWAESQRNSDE